MFLLNFQNKRNTSKMKKKDQETSPEKENEIDLFSLIDNNLKKEIMKMLKKTRENPNLKN